MLKATDNHVAGLSQEEKEQRQKDINEHTKHIMYSKKYDDGVFEYR